ncbi:hypothetical protein NMH_1233 [Neisseria meningitidis H44/76]|uniref:Uncharacterized protein n=2 Tax=Neisseria meningitidis TaxID=487 RepID=E6MXZ5_NEIMH|nr:hypothetical protein NMH_1233 [Neisseria meningitidis H44/76]CCA44328.1 hypothetical protein NMALPHA522_0787 [Neisseria meningitidis alpha522]
MPSDGRANRHGTKTASAKMPSEKIQTASSDTLPANGNTPAQTD